MKRKKYSYLLSKKTAASFFITQLLIFNYLLLPSFVVAQEMSQKDWKVRLTPVPLSFTNRATITGVGSATVTVIDNELIIAGEFSGLQGAATVAHIHLGPKAIPGPAILDLTLENEGDGKQGLISATLELTQEQLKALEQESLYIQIHSEVAPEGNLRGWILPIK